METINLYIIHKWDMEKLRALILKELNDTEVAVFNDLSGGRNTPIDADIEILQEFLLDRMRRADILVILIPNNMFHDSGPGNEVKIESMDVFMQEHMLIEYDWPLLDKPVVPISIFYEEARQYASSLRTGVPVDSQWAKEEWAKIYNKKVNPDTVIPLAIELNNPGYFARQLRMISKLIFHESA